MPSATGSLMCLLCPNLKDPQKPAVRHLALSHFILQSVSMSASALPSPNVIYSFVLTLLFIFSSSVLSLMLIVKKPFSETRPVVLDNPAR